MLDRSVRYHASHRASRRQPAPRFTVALLLSAVAAVSVAPTFAADVTVKHDMTKGHLAVTLNGKPFTTLRHKGHIKPILYPVLGPDQTPMTRSYPVKKGVKGEASDHPHHESLWFTHGNVNGENFWHMGKAKIMAREVNHKTANKDGVPSATITLKNEWVAADGKTIVCTDTTEIVCSEQKDGSRTIDYAVTVHASQGDVTFKDDKEGTMGIRTHPNLRVTGGKGVTDHNGQAINSAGDKDKALWGKKAAWVAYWGKIPKDGDTYGIAIFDHPTNLRHPTTWHARTYGLVAANPFGLSFFTGKRKENPNLGNFTIKKGESQRFKYRFVFFKGEAKQAKVQERFEAWAKTGK